MISLLLTLFISLFSYCPSINSIEDHKENILVYSDAMPSKSIYNYNGQAYYLSTEDFTFSKIYYGGLNSFGEVWSLYDNREFVYEFTGNQVSEIRYNVLQNNNDDLSSYQLSTISRVRVGKEIANGYINYFVYFYTTSYEQDVRSFGCDYFVYPNLYRYSSGDLTGDLCTTQYWYINDSNNFLVYHRGLIISFYGSGGYDLWDWFTASTEPNEYDLGFDDGRASGYQEGYNQALQEFDDYDDTALTIFQGIFDVGLLPVNVFLTIFNFELFGVNIAGIVSGLLTLSIVIIIVRMLLGGKKDD